MDLSDRSSPRIQLDIRSLHFRFELRYLGVPRRNGGDSSPSAGDLGGARYISVLQNVDPRRQQTNRRRRTGRIKLIVGQRVDPGGAGCAWPLVWLLALVARLAGKHWTEDLRGRESDRIIRKCDDGCCDDGGAEDPTKLESFVCILSLTTYDRGQRLSHGG